MKPSLHTPKLALYLFCLFLLAACKKDPGTNITADSPVVRDTIRIPPPAPAANIPPVADAGADQLLMLPTDSALLRGKGTDADGTIASYQWIIEGYHTQRGQYVHYSFPTQEARLKDLQEGIYWCTLRVTDNGGLSHNDLLVLRVVSPGCACYPEPCDAFGDPCDPWDY